MNTDTPSALFLLSPALSLGGRKKRSPLIGGADAVGPSTGSRSKRQDRDDSSKGARRLPTRRWPFPLPEREGLGEGEQAGPTAIGPGMLTVFKYTISLCSKAS